MKTLKPLALVLVSLVSLHSIAMDSVGGTIIYEKTPITLDCLERDMNNACVRALVDTPFCKDRYKVVIELSNEGRRKMESRINEGNADVDNAYEDAQDVVIGSASDALTTAFENTVPEALPDSVDFTIRASIGTVPLLVAGLVDVIKYPFLATSRFVHQKISKRAINKQIQFLLDESSAGKTKTTSKMNVYTLLSVLKSAEVDQ